MCESTGIDEAPFECAFVIASFLRTVDQGEPSTLDGDCATLCAVCDSHGRPDDPDAVRRWLLALGDLPDREVPDELWLSMIEAHDADRRREE